MLNKTIAAAFILFSGLCSAAQTVIEVIPLANRPAAELQPLIAPLLEQTDHLVGNGFSLIVKTTPERLAGIKELIKKLDTALANLSIRVIQSKDHTADQLNAKARLDVIIPGNNPVEFKGKININQQNQQNVATSEQVLKTVEGKPAYIKIGSNHPVRYTAVSDYGYGQHSISTHTQFIEATTGFAVLPRLNGEQVSLEISPWSDQMNSTGSIETQSIKTLINAKLGQWVEIGTIAEQSQSTGYGLLSVEQSNRQNVVHVLVQVEKAY
jgi:type II secretory pathway component GspD/PulD (secretin)